MVQAGQWPLGTRASTRTSRKRNPSPSRSSRTYVGSCARNKKAQAHFKAFPAGQQRDYIVWVTEAKQDATRAKRIKTAVEWIAEGKIRNWKYLK